MKNRDITRNELLELIYKEGYQLTSTHRQTRETPVYLISRKQSANKLTVGNIEDLKNTIKTDTNEYSTVNVNDWTTVNIEDPNRITNEDKIVLEKVQLSLQNDKSSIVYFFDYNDETNSLKVHDVTEFKPDIAEAIC